MKDDKLTQLNAHHVELVQARRATLRGNKPKTDVWKEESRNSQRESDESREDIFPETQNAS